MGDHFALDVRPDQVLAAARRIGALADEAGRHGHQVTRAPQRWRAHWQSSSSSSLGEQAEALGRQLDRAREHLERAARCLQGYGRRLDRALHEEIPDLNHRWRMAAEHHDGALAQARRQRTTSASGLDPELSADDRDTEMRRLDAQHRTAVSTADSQLHSAQEKLEAEYDELKRELGRLSRSVGATLAEEVIVRVTPTEVIAFRAGGHDLLGGLLGWLGSDPLAAVADRARASIGGPLGRLQAELADPPEDLEELRVLLEQARSLGIPPDQYAGTLELYWRHRAAEAAGIDLSAWDPGAGAEANREIIEAVYRYYGDLYLDDPDLQWAGMANMIGPSFAAGFYDLEMFRDFAGSLEDLPEPLRRALPPGVEDLADWTEEDLRFFETAFLSMQQEIFFDQGSMHQAYVDGGLEAVRELEAAGLIPPDIARAWSDIDSGDPARVQSANELFLYREQFDIIDDDYQRMFDHTPTGPAMTWAMTLIGAPSIPGARGYPEVFPLVLESETPGPDRLITPDRIFGRDIPHLDVDNPAQVHVTVTTPLPDGNIAHFDDRWALIEQDTLPSFQRLLAEDPERARELIGADVGERIEDYRLQRRIDEILAQLRNWEVDVDQ